MKEKREGLTDLQYRVARECGTEPPFNNEYWNEHREGLYVDIVSGVPLFISATKFDSGTGWPSFDHPLNAKAIAESADHSHGMERVEVKSADSGIHLGHLFNDGPTETGQRYCVNSAALRFIPFDKLDEEGYQAYSFLFRGNEADYAIFAAGCFWGTQAYFRLLPGVLETSVGYSGGATRNPTYEEVCGGVTGHAEALLIRFDPLKISYPELLGHFFSMHDPYSLNRQGNDVGTQYRSAVFYLNDAQRQAAEACVAQRSTARKVQTQIRSAGPFWAAEAYHQDYLEKHPGGYCHVDLGPAKEASRKAAR
jgi:peptide methionine sulfoxide reductase msrA/msrB